MKSKSSTILSFCCWLYSTFVDFIYPKKGSNWHTVVIHANSITQNEAELVRATISLKDPSKLVVGSFYQPPNKGVRQILELENHLLKLRIPLGTTPKLLSLCAMIFNAGGY